MAKALSWWKNLARNRAAQSRKALGLTQLKLQRSLEELTSFLICSIAVFLFVPVAFLCARPDLTHPATLVFLLALIALSAYPGFCVLRLRRAIKQDLRAELEVAEKLNQLQSPNCHVFHDHPTLSDWRVDHVLIDPSGIYAIETITERKPANGSRKANHEVFFDGNHLHFPRYIDSDALGTARHSASELSWELSRATGEPVEVTAVLAIPDCRIVRNGSSEVIVVNQEELCGLISKSPKVRLAPPQIERLVRAMKSGSQVVEDQPMPRAAAA
jgi:hypothetical protein